ncbi:hypothetical protein HBA55_29520 [Pseudomaricurvus alkylphenolicus]|uniref:hypothetical protein n=1 Tax=Pseudomaricurvus alkylphenolicus TaxID=1306991 RepID=UPI00141EE94D|nr:hypothetical protein [Pseudomaricurvus alkylphenolicus]NIB43778.1 hypothetical protein [Pseudomaricurvus alkylphenolicus]
MQFIVSINQVKALEWGLNAQQAILFAWLYGVPAWADCEKIDGAAFFNVAKSKIIYDLPILTDKPDTAYRLLKQLQGFGLIKITSKNNKTYFRMLDKAKGWNFEEKGSEKNPTLEAKGRKNIRSKVGKKSEPGSEKSPTNPNTNNPDINDPNSKGSSGDEPTSKKFRFTDDDLVAAQYIWKLVHRLNDEHKEPNLESWANTVRLMRERDKRTHRQICEVFAWANRDHFWQTNVLSPSKLREKFDALSTKMKQGAAHATHQQPRKQSAVDENSAAADEFIARLEGQNRVPEDHGGDVEAVGGSAGGELLDAVREGGGGDVQHLVPAA